MDNYDATAHQLEDWQKKNNKNSKSTTKALRPDGRPYESLTSTLTLGHHGPPLLQDTECVEVLQNFTRKGIRARYVHAKGIGAHGSFQLTNPEMFKYSKAKMFQPDQIGKKLPVFGRFSPATEDQRADNVRTLWAFSMKFYTQDGNLDLLCLQTPMFNISNPTNFVNLNNCGTRNPQTGLGFDDPDMGVGFADPNSQWDFFCNRPEVVHHFLFLMSDRGLPLTIRHLNVFPINIFKLVNAQGDFFYARFHIKTNQGVRFLKTEEARNLRKNDPDFVLRDMYNAIERKDYPSYTWFMQMMEKDEPEKYFERTGWHAFDVTKVWPQGQFPLIEIGQIVFDRNIDNHFEESVSSAFFPGNLVPGIEAAVQDKLFHGRIFAYIDAHIFRLGANKSIIPINRPKGLKKGEGSLMTYEARCPMNFQVGVRKQPNYYPNSFGGPKVDDKAGRDRTERIENARHDFNDVSHEDNFGQPKIFYEKVIQDDERGRIAENIAMAIRSADPAVQKRVIQLFSNVSEDLGQRMSKILNKLND